jgi:Raf kinase inhibitor-like YbhB/YbcL family protein
MKQRVLIFSSLGILLLVACAVFGGIPTSQQSGEPEAASTVEPTEPPAPATETPVPSPMPTPTEAAPEPTEPPLPFELISTAFEQGEPVPAKYSCKGEDISPSLAWGDPPDGTQSLALIMDDPDAPGGTWVHWIVFNIPADVRELPEAMPAGMKFGDVAVTFGRNSWGRSDYGGPCPPSGTHRYFFKLYALDTNLPSDETMKQNQVLAAMDGHILAETELMGTFSH